MFCLQNAEGLLDQALRVFGLLGAVSLVIIEVEWERVLLLVHFAEYWVGRSVIQVHISWVEQGVA